MTLRRISIALILALVTAGGWLYSQNRHTDGSGADTTYRTFTVKHTTTITEQAGSLTLRFSPPLKVVMAAKASTDKGYFSLKCVGHSSLIKVPGNGQWVAVTCRLAEVHYTDNSATTGMVILEPRH